MNVHRYDSTRAIVELTHDELLVLNNALNEVCSGLDLQEFQTRMGVERDEARSVLEQIHTLIDKLQTSAPAKMGEYEQLLDRAKWGKLSHTELFEVADELRKSDPAADRFTLLNILGNAFALEYQPLVEQYLGSEEDPMRARLALEILCGYWGKTNQYLEEVLSFMQGVSWDDEEDVRGIAISVAGEYLRSNREGRFLEELLRIFEDKEEEHINREDAYFALARAMGREWVELPSAARHFDLATEIDPVVIHGANERLSEEHG